jgi:hypothetical protein
MMYHNKLVASIKANRKVLREFKDKVYVPFASEYSILLKNLNTVRAEVHVYIDGEDQTPDGLCLDAGRECELERSIKNGNLKEGNKFKFIERTDAVEQHRGIKLEDGIVRVEYRFEKPRVSTPISQLPSWQMNSLLRGIQDGSITASGASGNSGAWGSASGGAYSAAINNVQCSATSANVAPQSFYNDAGVTVAGSKSTQSFTTVSMGEMELDKHTIVLQLLGETPDNKPVQKAVTVKAKQKCDTCGHTNKATAEFCNKCGTALVIYA